MSFVPPPPTRGGRGEGGGGGGGGGEIPTGEGMETDDPPTRPACFNSLGFHE